MRRFAAVGIGLTVAAVAVAALLIAMSMRYEYVNVNGQLVRMDRWTGQGKVAKAHSDKVFSDVAAKGKTIQLPPEELSRLHITARMDVPEAYLRPGDLSAPYALHPPRLVLQVDNQSSYSVEWLELDVDGTSQMAYSEIGPGFGPGPGERDTFHADLPEVTNVREWRVVAAHGYPPKR